MVPIKKEKLSHRERLRQRFLARDERSHTDESLLELLLTFAIPQKDVQPLAKQLIAKFGSLQNVLSADSDTLCKFDGLKTHSAVLLKLIDWIRLHHSVQLHPSEKKQQETLQSTLFESFEIKKAKESPVKAIKKIQPRRVTSLFGKAVLKESIALAPKIPDTSSINDVREFLRNNLHFSAAETRRRYSNYIISRLFPMGFIDKPMKSFAVKYANRQELKDVCFYRFCIAESLMFDVIDNLFLPSIGAGRLKRERLREYLQKLFPSSKMIGDSAKAIVDALTAGGIVSADHATIHFSYRDILPPSFAFIVLSEFPEQGMYDITKLETNRSIRAMLWNPARIRPALYELRNQGFISKISEIDKIRQFTTKLTLEEVVKKLINEKDRT